MMILTLLLPVILWLVNYLLCVAYSYTHTQIKSFECGFEHHHWVKTSPSLHFFKLGLVFIMFDLEIMFLMALLYTETKWMSMALLLFIWGTLWFEYATNSLTWNV